jgi:hypothetical protein
VVSGDKSYAPFLCIVAEDSSLPRHIAGFLAFGSAPNFLLGIGSVQPPDITGLANAPTARTTGPQPSFRGIGFTKQGYWNPSQGDRKIFIEKSKRGS